MVECAKIVLEFELPVLIHSVPAQAAEGAMDALYEFTVFLTFGVLDGCG
jgi:hypothetical protein